MSNINIAEVREWAKAGGDLACHYFNNVTGKRKEDHSRVTQADIEIEQMLRERISSRYPDHGIMGEEQGIGSIDREYVWSLDPLDGTDAFLDGLPGWAISIGVLRNGEPHLGVIYVPTTGDCYWNDPAGAAYRNDYRIHVADTTDFRGSDWIIVTSRAHTDYTITFPGKTRSLGSFAAHLCYVARGSTLGAIIGFPRLWDVAAGLAIVKAAGGVAVTLDGQPLQTSPMLDGTKPSQPLLVSTPALVEKLLACIEFHGNRKRKVAR